MISSENITVLTKTAQIRRHIEGLIERLEPGDQLLSESKLAEKFNVSIITIKRSLDELVREGSVYKRQGKGTFVAEKSTGEGDDSSTFNLVYPFVPRDAFKDPFLGQVISGISDCFGVNSRHLRLFPLHGKSTIESCLKDPAARKMLSSGIIAVNYIPTEKDEEAIKAFKCPAVLIGKPKASGGIPFVNTDHFTSGYETILHLIKKHSRKRTAILGGDPVAQPYCLDIIDGHKKGLKESGIGIDEKLFLPSRKGVTMSMLVDELVDMKVSFDSMIIYGCKNTIESLKRLRQHGLDVPADVLLVAYGDFPVVSEYSNPTITAVHQPVYELGYEAARQILKQKNTGMNGNSGIILKNSLIIRDSCGCGVCK
ncbi:MAG: GntR family transcriptional regulator [Victivallales bacterium]|jgi:DNA-binding LacI/PurR family transcriptional regulator